MKNIKPVVALFLIIFFSCSTNSNHPDSFIRSIENAHHKKDFLSHHAVKFDISIEFGGTERLNGTFTLLTNSSKGLIELQNGNTIIYDNDKVFHSPDIENPEKVRFDAFTWSYFFLFPYKLSDPGTKWTAYNNEEPNHANYETKKLTFEPGTGDAPDDWYIVYANKTNHLIEATAYIVTANKPKEKAEENPHAIQYLNYEKIRGIPIATEWNFKGWGKNTGPTDKIGSATLSNLKFIDVKANFFKPPANYLEK